MKRSVKILFAVAIVLSFQFSVLSSAFAQFAGEDKKIAREPGNTQKVDIGRPDPANDVCYMWTGPHIDGNANQAVVTVNPHDTLEIYQVKRISKNGIEEDEVKVRVEDTISIVSVRPKYKCYRNDEGISTSQFEIVTEPEGYERLVTVTPNTASSSIAISNHFPVTFNLTHNGHTSTKTAEIVVYNSDVAAPEEILVGALQTLEYLIKHRVVLRYVWDNVERLSNIINSKATTLSPCNWSLDTKPDKDFDDGLSISPRMLCCGEDENHASSPALKFQFGKLSYGNSFGCRFPFYGVPYVASADFVFNLSAEMFLGPCNGVISTNKDCNQFCIPLGCTLAANGGVGVSLGGGKLLSADLLIQGAWTTQIQWCPIGSSNSLSVGITFSVIGQVVTLGMIKHSVEYPFATYSTSIDLPNVFF